MIIHTIKINKLLENCNIKMIEKARNISTDL